MGIRRLFIAVPAFLLLSGPVCAAPADNILWEPGNIITWEATSAMSWEGTSSSGGGNMLKMYLLLLSMADGTYSGSAMALIETINEVQNARG
jgi:hypothetical protein